MWIVTKVVERLDARRVVVERFLVILASLLEISAFEEDVSLVNECCAYIKMEEIIWQGLTCLHRIWMNE